MAPVQAAAETSTEPLRPAACVMALLPPVVGPPYAPAALRHLMQPGSPIASLYELCDQCETMGRQAAKVNAAGIRKRLRLRSCQEALERARELYDARAGKQLEAEIESRGAENHFRFSAAAAYYELVQRRIAELRETRIPGLQTFGEFIERRLAPAMNTCMAASVRQEAL